MQLKAHSDRGLKVHRTGESGFFLLEMPRGAVLFFGAVLFLLLVASGAGGLWAGSRFAEGRAQGDKLETRRLPDEEAPTYSAQPGPWGELRFQRSIMQVPEDYLGVRSWQNEPVRWFFKGWQPEPLETFLSRIELADTDRRALLDHRHWQVSPAGVTVHPPMELLYSLPAQARDHIYAELGKFDENVMQSQPFHWPLATERTLFSGQPVSAKAVEVFKKLCYRRGKSLLFSDWQALLAALPDDRERTAIAQALTGRYVIFASLRVTPRTDIDALIAYWGKGGFGKDIRPMLEAAASVPGGVNLSLAYLLPPHVRVQLNTFPLPNAADQLNCHWTSFNFFQRTPSAPAGTAEWTRKLDHDYVKISDAPEYGDIVVLRKPGGTMIHSCVYLADNLVYTKNGASALAPWELMTLPDLLEFYSWDLPEGPALQVDCYRRRNDT